MAITKLRPESADLQASAREFLEGFRCPAGTSPFTGITSGDLADDLIEESRALMFALSCGFSVTDEDENLGNMNPHITHDALRGVEKLLALAQVARKLERSAKRLD